MQTLSDALQDTACGRCPMMRQELEQVGLFLSRGRADFDALHGDTGLRDDQGAIRGAIERMIQAVRPFLAIRIEAFYQVSSTAPEVINSLDMLRLTSELREQAGRYGAYLVEALVTGRNLTRAEIRDGEVIMERIQQLRDGLATRAMEADTDPRLRQEIEHMRHGALETALRSATSMWNDARAGNPPSMTPTQFFDSYAPGLEEPMVLRNELFDEIQAELARQRALAWQSLLIAMIAGVVLEGVVVWVMIRFRGRYVVRLAQLSGMLSALYGERPRGYARE
ncbi:hypothetical protein ACQV88_26065, partial [Ralstonia pseudosolanacearum]|uniref:hypothetical protein n=1 Tax=Ralstonia pseudosolanacearum TaxID=1310165 RepID=UPI003D27B9A1